MARPSQKHLTLWGLTALVVSPQEGQTRGSVC